MLVSFFKKLWQQIIRLLVVGLVLLAAYVSIGREFMPAVSGAADFVEKQITVMTGLPVNINSLTGSFRGFNPTVRINGLQLLVDNVEADGTNPASALRFEHAVLTLDVLRSIWRRNWVFEEFVIDGLAVVAQQTESGAWQLRDINVNGAGSIDPAAVYRAFTQVAQLDLRDVQVELNTRNQNTIQINNGSAVIQNRNGNHFLHVDGNLANSAEQLQLSIEARGNSLDAITGQAHLRIPGADYTDLLEGETLGQVSINELTAGAQFWMQLERGRVSRITSSLTVDSALLQTTTGNVISLHDVSGDVRLSRDGASEDYTLTVNNMTAGSGENLWQSFNAQIAVVANTSISVQADLIDLSFLNRIVSASGVLSDAAAEQFAGYNPQGQLSNFSLYWPLAQDAEDKALITTNLNGVELGSVNGSPGLWGLDGYLQTTYDASARIARGFGEVESNRFRINIPSVFVDTWDYNYVNGRLDFRIDLNDGQHINMVSSVIRAESDIVDGHVQFASAINRYADGTREANLDLLVGVQQVDAARKAPYLPNAPTVADNLKQTMQWLNAAVLGGEIRNSGVIYRGSTVAGSPAESKTFQSFYVLEDGELLFSDEWPKLSDISGYVLTNDDLIDIEVSSAASLGINAENVIASVRSNERQENWLDITGVANAQTAALLAYLQAAPVGDGLRNALRSWQAKGDFKAQIGVRVPLSSPGADTDVRLDIALDDNSLELPEYALNIINITGPVVFDTRTGLEDSKLTGELFDQEVVIELSSLMDGRVLQQVQVDAAGAVTPEALIQWPRQSDFVRHLLADMDGQFEYTARVQVPQSGDAGTRLTIDTPLQGASLTLPEPFAKSAATLMPLHLDIDFTDQDQDIAGQLGANTEFKLRLENGEFQGGLLTLGENYTGVDRQITLEPEGLAVMGHVDHLVVEQWVDYLSALSDTPTQGGAVLGNQQFGNIVSFIDLSVGALQVYEQNLPDVDVYIDSNAATGYWDFTLAGEAVAGTVNVPYDSNDYLLLDLTRLHLPGEPESGQAEDDQSVQVRVDALAQIDPRTLPKMKFSADAISIGERPFGSWQFTLNPDSTGAEFTDLAFNFRGLRIEPAVSENAQAENTQAATAQAHFSWLYDGESHSSALQGILHADNIADVLTANGFAPSLNSSTASFDANITWPGSPAFFAGANLSGDLSLKIEDGRFQQATGGSGALKLISIINFDAIMRRLRFSNDLLRSGLAYDSIEGNLQMQDGTVNILDQLVISGPSSLYQITGKLDLADQTIDGEMYLTLPVSANIPWLGLLTANLPLAVGAYLFDRIFGDQVNNLTSAVYTLKGPWEGLQPQFKQAFGAPGNNPGTEPATTAPGDQ